MIAKSNKYHNTKLETSDGKFDSKKEYQEWLRLKHLEKLGLISHLERQKEFQLIPTIKTTKETLRRTSYFADFFYYDNNLDSWVIFESKGYKTKDYITKKKLLIYRYVINDDYIFIESINNKINIYKKPMKL